MKFHKGLSMISSIPQLEYLQLLNSIMFSFCLITSLKYLRKNVIVKKIEILNSPVE
jgi:hypothetical protein